MHSGYVSVRGLVVDSPKPLQSKKGLPRINIDADIGEVNESLHKRKEQLSPTAITTAPSRGPYQVI